MDGTMIETESLWKDANTELAQKYNAEFVEELRPKMMGKNSKAALTIFKEFLGLTVSVEELIANQNRLILEKIPQIKINKGVYELLDLLDTMDLKKAVATSSVREFAHKVLGKFNLLSRFDAIITGDEVTKSKPDPDIFLHTAKRLDVDPINCLVLEDTQAGVEAAYNARMKVIAIPHTHSQNQDFSKATKIISSLKKIDGEFLLQF